MLENKISVDSIIEKLKEGESYDNCGIEVTNYLPISHKNLICENIVLNCIEESEGLKFANPITKEMNINAFIIRCYTNLYEEDYDELCEYGIMDYVLQKIYKEYNFICDMVNTMIENELMIHNSLSGVINRNLQTLISKIPTDKEMSKILNKIPKTIEKISPENLEIIKGIIDGKLDSPQPNREQRRKAEKAENSVKAVK